MSITFTDEQNLAVKMALENNVSILCGAPGTGKTTVAKKIIDELRKQKLSIALAAPTGKAAKRMTEATGNDAVTIHRLLEPYMQDDDFQFQRDEERPLEQDVIIVDEASMIDTRLMSALLRAIVPAENAGAFGRENSQRLLIIGDHYQLPSVGPGAVLRDIIASGKIPVTELTKIQRNAGDIVRACHRIKDGQEYTPSPKLDIATGENLRHLPAVHPSGVISMMNTLYDRLATEGYNLVWDVQILSPVNEKGDLSCSALNTVFQQRLNPNPEIPGILFRTGDKVLWTKNLKVDSADGMGGVLLVNGDMGTVKDIPKAGKRMVVRFDDPVREVFIPKNSAHLILAYACTVHRYQGSEAPVVIIPIHSSISFMMDRAWLYTAISRAKDACITVGDFSVIRQAIRRTDSLNRQTFLREKLCEQY